MTKEELKLQREVKEWLATDHNGYNVQSLMNFIRKQTKSKDEQIRALQKQNEELTDKVKELEAQIEKMKRCGNCRYGYRCNYSSATFRKVDGVEHTTQNRWNEEKKAYCSVGYEGKYECWEIME